MTDTRLTDAINERDAIRATLQDVVTHRDKLSAQLEDTKRDLDILRRADFNLGHDRWLPALKQAERERTEAQTCAEAAEKERDRLRVALKETQEKANHRLHLLQRIGKGLGCQESCGESHAEWAERLILEVEAERNSVAIKEAVARAEAAELERDEYRSRALELEYPMRSSVPALPCTGAHCVPNDEHQRVVNEVAALTKARDSALSDFAAASQENIRLRVAFETLKAIHIAGVSALVRG